VRQGAPPQEPPRVPRRCTAAAPALLCLLLAAASGLGTAAGLSCSRRGGEGPAPGAGAEAAVGWPAGALLLARRSALEGLLADLSILEGTPLAAQAARVRAALPPGCPLLAGSSQTGSLHEAAAIATCLDPTSPLAALEPELAERDLVFALPGGPQGRVRGSLSRASGGSLRGELWLPPDAAAGARALLLPGASPPGPPILASGEALLHARLRPASGLDLAALVPEGSQGDRLFRLRSRLFAGAALDGTWEAALYPPEPGGAAPLAALALGAASPRAAALAMGEFASELERSWPVHRTPFRLGEASGACLLDLNLLPELAPCYVARAEALVVGWNPASLRRALAAPAAAPAPGTPGAAGSAEAAGSAGAEPDLGDEGGLVVHLGRIREADAGLAAAAGFAPRRALPGEGRWQELRLRGGPAGAEHRLELELLARAPEGAAEGTADLPAQGAAGPGAKAAAGSGG
jgi:hypothetical protein